MLRQLNALLVVAGLVLCAAPATHAAAPPRRVALGPMPYGNYTQFVAVAIFVWNAGKQT